MTNLLTTGTPTESERITHAYAQPGAKNLNPCPADSRREAENPNAHLTDAQLYGLCKEYGMRALEARRKFIGLLPEVYKRHLYAKKGFASIKEFAARLAGISEEQVNRALNLEKRFADKPALKMALTSGEVSINKLARVASIATVENQQELAEMAKVLPKSALETLVRDGKSVRECMSPRQTLLARGAGGTNQQTLPATGAESVPGHMNPQQSLSDVNLLGHLDYELQKDLIARHEKGININALLKELLQKHDEEISQQKAQLSAQAQDEAQAKAQAGRASSRYVKVAIRKILKKEYGDKCAKPGCRRPSTQIHHADRFALSQTHDPRFMAPLCAEHHSIAHAIDVKYQLAKRRL